MNLGGGAPNLPQTSEEPLEEEEPYRVGQELGMGGVCDGMTTDYRQLGCNSLKNNTTLSVDKIVMIFSLTYIPLSSEPIVSSFFGSSPVLSYTNKKKS